MQDMDAAYTMSGGGNLSVVNEITVNDTRFLSTHYLKSRRKPESHTVYSLLKMTYTRSPGSTVFNRAQLYCSDFK